MDSRLKNNPKFRQLRQGGLDFTRRTSFWLGSDHLLLVDVSNYNEQYRRLYFHDIQAITIQATQTRVYLTALLLLPPLVTGAWLLFGLYSEIQSGWQDPYGLIAVIVLGVVSLAFLLLPVISWLRGPTCAVHVRTAVQTQRLRGVTRWRKAEELVAELTPLIQAAQVKPAATSTPASELPASGFAADSMSESPTP